ncbi:cardiolipin synthase ClsB [Pseudomethylobacillus aquaticus]|uniref:Cardiolipin synthase B n=1 Tax=Pseudomethylobacillus aquaticus TaxID=2676064 RepID=A0A3N0V2H8_9PROT|nr:cardiolipin synthase ClsB [Pseudomethylobacillus aquaticus]ROH86905.1 cardiolipin synthase ClsB [Pseudomethylobacillus aquaticus]
MTRFVANNQITLLRNGEEYFPALLDAIASARYEVHLQTFIFEADDTGLRVAAALQAAAQRGVSVHVLLDGYGSRKLTRTVLDGMRAEGIEVTFYRPQISPWTLQRNRLRRLHRKVSVIDGTTAFVGGINIIDDLNVPNGMPPRVDYALRLQGPLVKDIHTSCVRLWQRISWANLQRTHSSRVPLALLDNPPPGQLRAAFVVRDNLLNRRAIERAYLKAIGNAREEILIANAYFVPGRRFRRALVSAARRGVKVRLLLQGRMEYWLMLATHAFYRQFLREGIVIHEYHKSFMHSKVAVIDGRWATVGSSNIDPFSLLLAREANVMVLDADFSQQLRSDIERSIRDGGQQVHADDWERERWGKRVVSWLVFGMVRVILGMLGHSNKH